MATIGKETDQALLEMKDKELIQIYKLRLILNEIKSLDCDNLPALEREKIKEAIEQLKLSDFHLNADEQDISILGIRNFYSHFHIYIHYINFVGTGVKNSPILSYSEKKILQEKVTMQLHEKLDRILEMRSKMEDDGILEAEEKDQVILKSLEERRAVAMNKALETRALKYRLLKKVAELKYGSDMSNKLDYLLTVAMQNETKSKILQGFFNNHLLNRYEHAEEALNELQEYLEQENM